MNRDQKTKGRKSYWEQQRLSSNLAVNSQTFVKFLKLFKIEMTADLVMSEDYRSRSQIAYCSKVFNFLTNVLKKYMLDIIHLMTRAIGNKIKVYRRRSK